MKENVHRRPEQNKLLLMLNAKQNEMSYGNIVDKEIDSK